MRKRARGGRRRHGWEGGEGWVGEREIKRKERDKYQTCTLLKGSGMKEGERRET